MDVAGLGIFCVQKSMSIKNFTILEISSRRRLPLSYWGVPGDPTQRNCHDPPVHPPSPGGLLRSSRKWRESPWATGPACRQYIMFGQGVFSISDWGFGWMNMAIYNIENITRPHPTNSFSRGISSRRPHYKVAGWILTIRCTQWGSKPWPKQNNW